MTPKKLEKSVDDLGNIRRTEKTTPLKSMRTIGRFLETWGNLLSPRQQEKENSQELAGKKIYNE